MGCYGHKGNDVIHALCGKMSLLTHAQVKFLLNYLKEMYAFLILRMTTILSETKLLKEFKINILHNQGKFGVIC